MPKRDEQKINPEVNGDNAPRSLKNKSKPEGVRDDSEPVKKERKPSAGTKPEGVRDDSEPARKERKPGAAAKLAETQRGQGNDPARISGDSANEETSKPPPDEELSVSEFEDALGKEVYKLESSEDREKKARGRPALITTYIKLIGSRISSLEEELRNFKNLPTLVESVGLKSEDGSRLEVRDAGTLLKVIYQTWESFQGPDGAIAVVEVLIGDPGIPKMTKGGSPGTKGKPVVVRKSRGFKMSTEVPLESRTKLPNRIRVRSPHILKTLKTVSSVNPRNEESVVILRPFKTLVRYEESIREEARALEEKIRSAKKANVVEEDSDSDVQDNATPEADEFDNALPFMGPENKLEAVPTLEDIQEAEQALAHIRLLEQFIDKDLKPAFDLRNRIKKRRVRTIAFDDLWLLFNPGDIVYSRTQAFEVLSTTGGQPLDKEKVQQYRQEVTMDENGHYLYREHETVSPFVVDCYYIGFDGKKYGAVQVAFRISAYYGEKSITGLPIYPARFSNDSQRDYFLERGRSYLSLTQDKGSFAHRQYDSLVSTADGDNEEVNSRVIIDFTTAFRMHPKWCPDFGLKGPSPADPREVTECGVLQNHDLMSCFHCYCDGIWEDHRSEQLHASEHMDKVGEKLGKLQQTNTSLTEDQIILLPDTVFGFVLRNRKWVAFNIDDITDIIPTEENFNDLVIPSRHKKIVEALVKTHSRGPITIKRRSKKEDTRHNPDLIRGKGEGIIILLHGPPGVGKTSTAECVAELCNRPLFQITCGDIGTEPKDVERNLDDNFRLAHRWGCVLLLDEADVFLSERNQGDLKRNSLVSVFLRVLEYYPGILFLTTNRVGRFDEAFKSRIHVSLQFPTLDKKSSLKVWANNIRRLKWKYDIDAVAIMIFAERNFESLRWNGRQIKNAFQVVIAMAEFNALKNAENARTQGSGESGKVELKVKFFKRVADASEGFDKYIEVMFGHNAEERALLNRDRMDEFEPSQRKIPHSKVAPQGRGPTFNDGGHSSSSPSLLSSDTSADSSDSTSEPQQKRKKKATKEKDREPERSAPTTKKSRNNSGGGKTAASPLKSRPQRKGKREKEREVERKVTALKHEESDDNDAEKEGSSTESGEDED